MTSSDIRTAFLNFFRNKDHKIVDSAPLVIKNDPTLMFTNAGMNQFKDYFLGNSIPETRRIANTQKCLRVTGKHNDLEEVGHDTYHHTFFEMLGNWSFGNYFKEEAINWAWEFLTEVVKLDRNRIYTTVFEGDPSDNLGKDEEAIDYWKKILPEEHILNGSKKDNFWEMGNTGPCGPCSEIHFDLRDDKERQRIPGHELVNKEHPLVIEIWNLVFIQYNRKADQSLEMLPEKHVDTGMGFERLCMVIQGKKSNYDTDVFSPLISEISILSGFKYGENEDRDVAMRVISDHLRAISFSIAEDQLPSNTKAGYLIRRILRRAIRYAYTYLDQDQPFIYQLVPVFCNEMGQIFKELPAREELIRKVIFEEEQSFLSTLENGIKRLGQMKDALKNKGNAILDGKLAFELYDTYGFPVDLTELILREEQLKVDEEGFLREMELQKQRSKKAAITDKSDWIILSEEETGEFTGYDTTTDEIRITRYREVKSKKKTEYHLVFNHTPFYAESGGQVGDNGIIENGVDRIIITDTRKENELIVHITDRLPGAPEKIFKARVNESNRLNTAGNHTATHLLHFALREILGKHVEQKGSLVSPDQLRFDFSHFQKVTDDEIREIEIKVNSLIRMNIPLDEKRAVPITEANEMGAISLFGEKYGEQVRVIRFGESIELCGGIHAAATGQLGFFKILKESSVSAGIRRIEAVTGTSAEKHIYEQYDTVKEISILIEKSSNIVEAVRKLTEEHTQLNKEIAKIKKDAAYAVVNEIKDQCQKIGSVNFIGEILPPVNADELRNISFKLKNEISDLFLVLGTVHDNKPLLSIMISDNLVKEKKINASTIIREISKEIKGGGGGQPFFATAGGRDPEGLPRAIARAKEILESVI